MAKKASFRKTPKGSGTKMRKDPIDQIMALIDYSSQTITKMRRQSNASLKKGFRFLVVRIQNKRLLLDGKKEKLPHDFQPLPVAYNDIALARAARRREIRAGLKVDEEVVILDCQATKGNPSLIYADP